MKTKLAAALSVSGVLVAGSAAAWVNTQVLQNSNADSGSATSAISVPTSTVADGALTPSTTIAAVSTTVAGAVPSTTAAMPTASTVTTAPTSTVGTAAGAASTQAVYRIGDAGTVTLDTAGDRLTLVATAPSAGWQVGKVEQRSPLDIEIHFRSATVELEFKANLLFGVVSTSVESRNIGAPPAGGTAAPGPGTSVHHDDDDDDGGEQHSDDDHDGDHHGGGEHHEDDDD